MHDAAGPSESEPCRESKRAKADPEAEPRSHKHKAGGSRDDRAEPADKDRAAAKGKAREREKDREKDKARELERLREKERARDKERDKAKASEVRQRAWMVGWPAG